MTATTLITGAAGFLGRHAVRGWVEAEPGRPPRALVHRPSAELAALFPGVETFAGDLLDRDLLRRALAGAGTVVHLASKNVDHDGTGFERVNVEGTRRLVAAAVAAGVSRFLYVSSVGVYGHGVHRDAGESTPLSPDTPFSRSKAAAEEAVLAAHRRGELTGVVLRHRFVYGEGDHAVLPRMIRAAGRYPFWIDGGRARMSLVLAADLAAVLRRLAALPREALAAAAEPVFHVTDGRPLSFRELMTHLCRTFDRPVPRFSLPLPLIYGPVRLRELLLRRDPETSTSSLTSIRLKLVAQEDSFSNAKLCRLLPDLRFTPFEEGFARSLPFYSQFAQPIDRGGV
jgi:nucleoside-diphosphate-sugar epimerase